LLPPRPAGATLAAGVWFSSSPPATPGGRFSRRREKHFVFRAGA
jgi:hypothetical protein